MHTNEYQSPTTKSKLRILVTTAQSNGELLKIELENQPDDQGPPYHYHPDQEETFTVLEGRLALRVAGKEFELGPGESATAKRNEAHTFWNPGSEVVRFTSEHRPAHGFEGFITSLYDLDYDGKVDDAGSPQLLQLMALFKPRSGQQFLQGPPQFLQQIGIAVLGRMGLMMGQPGTYVSQRREAGEGPV